MSEECNKNQFYKILLEYSDSKDITGAIREWNFVYSYMDKNHCICGMPIVENCIIEHKRTKNKLIIGNVCINKFLKKDVDYIFKGIKSVNDGKVPNKDFIWYCYEKGYLYDHQRDFLLDRFKKRKFSEKQESYLKKILYKLKLKTYY